MIITVSCYCQDITIHSKTILTRFSPMNFSSCVSSIELSLYTALHYVGKYSCVLVILLSLNVKDFFSVALQACFSGGMFALSSLHIKDQAEKEHNLKVGADLTNTCHESYIRTGTLCLYVSPLPCVYCMCDMFTY